MSEVFSFRSLVYWWSVLTATAFVKDWLRDLADFLRKPGMFSADKIPFSFLPGLNSWIDGAAAYVRDTVKFDPTQSIVTIGSTMLPGWSLALLLGAILLILAIALYMRALKSPMWFDDFLALFVVYAILRIEEKIAALTSLPLLESFRNFLTNDATTLAVMLVLLLILAFAGEGFRSKRAFWRAVVEAGCVSMFIFPAQTALAFSYVVDALWSFGAALTLPDNLPFAMLWGVSGMFLALYRLATQDGPTIKLQLRPKGGGAGPQRRPSEE